MICWPLIYGISISLKKDYLNPVLLVATRLYICLRTSTLKAYNWIYNLIELPFDWLIDDAMFVCLPDGLILCFCYSNLTRETGGFKLASTTTFVLTKCANHTKLSTILQYMYMHINIYKKILIKIDLVNDEGNTWNKIWCYTNDGIGVAVQSWLCVRVELMAW